MKLLKTTSKKISNKQFVQLWVEAYKNREGQAYIADRLGVSRQNVNSRGNRLRLMGINLPPLTARLSNNQIAELNNIIEDVTGENA